jgi:hypothetical protein
MSTQPADFGGLEWHKPTYRAVLIVSINAKKADDLYRRDDPKALRAKAVEMARRLRAQGGVRHTEAVVLNRWWPDPATPDSPHRPQPPTAAPWKPCGALVVVEADSDRTLEEYVRRVLEAAKAVDQNAMEFLGTDNW